MSGYNSFYREYLGVSNQSKNVSVYTSEFREQFLNRQYLYPVIFTDMDNKVICSTSSKYFELCKDSFTGEKESIYKVYESFKSQGNYSLREMYRYSLSNDQRKYDSSALTPTTEILRSLDFKLSSNVELYIEQRKEIIESKRQFAVVESTRIASTAFISDIYGSGCNIVVFTRPEYRGLGYGKEVVMACINWCLERELIPLYLVEKSNLASIALAESIGLIRKSHEWIITDLSNDSHS